MSHQAQPGTENPPYHSTNYAPRDGTTQFRAKVSHQVQLVPRNPTVATATRQEPEADEQQIGHNGS